MKKDKGLMEYSMSFLLLTVTVLVILYLYQLKMVAFVRNKTEDALAAANLAAAVIDLDTYEKENLLEILDFDKAYERYCRSLKAGLYLDDAWHSSFLTAVEGPVTVEEFTVYQVDGEDISMYSRGEAFGEREKKYPGQTGVLKTPDGQVIESTAIYSKIGFLLKGYGNQELYVYQENSVDIVSDYDPDEEIEDIEEKNR